MSRLQTIGSSVALGAFFFLALAAATVRAINDPNGPQFWGIFGGIAIGIGLVVVISACVWLPGGLTYMTLKRAFQSDLLLLAAREKSMNEAFSEFRATADSPPPHLYSPIVVTNGELQVWAGGLNPRLSFQVPRSAIVALSMAYAPIATITPTHHLVAILSTGLEVRFLPYGRSGLVPLSMRSLDDALASLSRALNVPIRDAS